MLCHDCRCWIAADDPSCRHCGRIFRADGVTYDLLLPGERRIRLGETATLGRSRHNTVTLDDPSVSRTHARIFRRDGKLLIEDASSSYGTFVDGHAVDAPEPLRDGARIRLGDSRIVLERRRAEYLSGRTRIAASAPAPGHLTGVTPEACPRVRVRSALKRLDADEGTKRFVLKNLDDGGFVRLGADDAALFERLDGSTSLATLREEAQTRFGAYGEFRLAALISDLSDAGLLRDGHPAGGAPSGWLPVLLRPRELATTRLGGYFGAIYRRGGWLLFTRPALGALALLIVIGLPVFAVEVFAGESTPLLVGDSLSLGALALIVGRLLVVVAHELAHGLAMAAVGRAVSRGGLRFLLVVPYAFVDTSDVWFERRGYRIGVSAAGPASDLACGAIAALLGAALAGIAGDVAFQVAICAYLSAFFNLHPVLPRDGYHIAVDVLREPDLRRRSREALARQIAGRGRIESRILRWYAIAALVWTIVGITWATLSLERGRDRLESAIGAVTTSAVIVLAAGALALPLGVTYGPPLLARARRREGSDGSRAR